MQGQLRNEHLSVDIQTECACCGQPLHLTVDSAMKYSVCEAGAEPLVFEPHVDWGSFREPNIIGAY